MTKKLISVWLSLTILLFSSISIYAEDNARGEYFNRDIVINGTRIINYQLEDPFFMYKECTYIPLNQGMGSIFGFTAELDTESRTLNLTQTDSERSDITEKWVKNNRQDVECYIVRDISVVAYETVDSWEADLPVKKDLTGVKAEEGEVIILEEEDLEPEIFAEEPEEELEEVIALPQLKATDVDLGGLPVLVKNGVFYIPLTAVTKNDLFGWDVHYDTYSGVYVSTEEGVPATAYFNEARSRYNKGLVNYVVSVNGSYTDYMAQELVFMFREASELYGVDLTLLMAMAQKESTFNASARSGAGALGLMQIMPSTARGYGITPTQLLDPFINIDLGTQYIRDRLSYYGDSVKALSAYNQGSGAVNRGSYTRSYATRVIGTQESLRTFLSGNGYGTGA